MTTELFYLTWAALLGLLNAIATGPFTTAQHGMAYGLSSREEKKEVTGMGGRVQRASANFMQSFPFFAAAVLVAHLTNHHGPAILWGVRLYFWARVAYLLCYAFDLVPWRTVAFLVSTLGIALVFIGLT